MPLSHRETAAKVQEEHDHLKAEMKKIYQLIDQDVSRENFASWRMDLLFLLRDFSNDLLKHFDLEEEGGFMNDVLRVAPQHRNAVQQLEEEHSKISEKLNGILSELKTMEEKDYLEFNKICSQVEDLLSLLKSHESREADLMVSTYFQDEGGGD